LNVVPPRTETGGGTVKENAGTALSQRTGLNGFIREGLYGALQRWLATNYLLLVYGIKAHGATAHLANGSNGRTEF